MGLWILGGVGKGMEMGVEQVWVYFGGDESVEISCWCIDHNNLYFLYALDNVIVYIMHLHRRTGDITDFLSLTFPLGSETLRVIVGLSRSGAEPPGGLRTCLYESFRPEIRRLKFDEKIGGSGREWI